MLAVGVSALPSPVFRGTIGHSGIVRPDGNNVQFSQAMADNIVQVGPSGIVTKDGRNIQLTDDLQFVHPRTKRHLIGDAGMITKDGIPIQFKRAGVTILLEGPSGYIMSDGTLVQKRSKRSAVNYGHTIGHSGIITNKGKLIQLDNGETVVSVGPSGAVLSSGRNVQF